MYLGGGGQAVAYHAISDRSIYNNGCLQEQFAALTSVQSDSSTRVAQIFLQAPFCFLIWRAPVIQSSTRSCPTWTLHRSAGAKRGRSNGLWGRISRKARSGMSRETVVHSWYVSYEVRGDGKGAAGRTYSRISRSFVSEPDAKKYAASKVAEGRAVTAGTINPHFPKTVVPPSQICRWIGESL